MCSPPMPLAITGTAKETKHHGQLAVAMAEGDGDGGDESRAAGAVLHATSGEGTALATCDASDRLLAVEDAPEEPPKCDGDRVQGDEHVEPHHTSSSPVLEAVPDTTSKEPQQTDAVLEHAAVDALATKRMDELKARGFAECTSCHSKGKRSSASVTCMEATCAFQDAPTCAACFEEQHSPEQDRVHRQSLLQACSHCLLKQVECWCMSCDLTFCIECFDSIHGGIKRVHNHRRVSVEGTPGSLLIRAEWKPHFLSAILDPSVSPGAESANEAKIDISTVKGDCLADVLSHCRKPRSPIPVHRTSGDTSSNAASSRVSQSAGEKRKRVYQEREVICIDDDSDGSAPDLSSSALTHKDAPVAPTQHDVEPSISEGSALPPYINSTSLKFVIPNSTTHSGHRPPAVAHRYIGMEPPRVTSTEPLAMPPQLLLPPSTAAQTSFITPSTAFTPIPSPARTGVSSAPSSTMSWPTPTTPSMATIHPSSGVDGMGSGQNSPEFTVATPNSSSVGENPLEQMMFERLDHLNQTIVQAGQTIVQLNSQIVQASYQSVQRAQALVKQLQEQKRKLEQIKAKRDMGIVQLVVQSASIIGMVKLLRLDLLGDIPQVQFASHQRCMQLSQLISQAKNAIINLNKQMAATLDNLGTMSGEAFHRKVSVISMAIQTKERTIEQLKREREAEIVRIVQYNHNIREALKRAVQQQIVQRMHNQQQQSQQQSQQQQEQLYHHAQGPPMPLNGRDQSPRTGNGALVQPRFIAPRPVQQFQPQIRPQPLPPQQLHQGQGHLPPSS